MVHNREEANVHSAKNMLSRCFSPHTRALRRLSMIVSMKLGYLHSPRKLHLQVATIFLTLLSILLHSLRKVAQLPCLLSRERRQRCWRVLSRETSGKSQASDGAFTKSDPNSPDSSEQENSLTSRLILRTRHLKSTNLCSKQLVATLPRHVAEILQ